VLILFPNDSSLIILFKFVIHNWQLEYSVNYLLIIIRISNTKSSVEAHTILLDEYARKPSRISS
jgi:hypothetical protein